MNKGVYIHYPFCDAKCLYCDFYSTSDTRKRELYEEALVTALLSYKEKGITADTVFFGGGTPSLMTEEGAKRVFSALREAFNITDNAEITLEANPSSLADFPERLGLFRSLGVNRLSLGSQSMQKNELEALGRRHSPLDVENTVKCARNMGFDNISLDLMVRIPHQTLETLEDTLSKALALSPEHLSLYTLSIEEKTVFGVRHKKGDDLSLADEDTEEEMWDKVCDTLSRHGFEHYEVSNFARDGRRSRHNLKYWQAEEYVGIGVAAHSYLDRERFYSPSSIDAFLENPLRRDGVEYISDSEGLAEYVMLSLRLSDGISLEKITPTPEFYTLAKRLEENGLARLSESTLSLTERGWRVSNSIIEEILNSLKLL
ncbi:MAG: radical SAM family heme chaperone HemW [Clostridia bacterium]|nr:radical SAM family heme chaperone HemW [Clostridia bacterium]